MFYNLRERRPALEEMDKPDIDAADLEGALRSLKRINVVAQSTRVFWPSIRSLLERHDGPAPLRILDLGCGAGDICIRLEAQARRNGFELVADGCDMNPIAVAMARREADAAGARGAFFVCDVVHQEIPDEYDMVISSLFLHHLSDDDTRTVLKRSMYRARRQLLFSDLLRSRLGLALVYLATRTLTRSRVVHQDGVTSLRAAYTKREIERLALEAGLTRATVRRTWPERFLLDWRRPTGQSA